ncbi:hypothetical protein IVB30_10310 [Bradyrhizobium sp. 200]|nr:hypothetical protein [Bradyrhizobium sp. 200]UPJ51700.1 hypothetical protein IVB30_10310 [Bradyrhizobium sp. 200]
MRASLAAATLSYLPICDGSLLVQCGTSLLGRRAATRRNALAVRSGRRGS